MTDTNDKNDKTNSRTNDVAGSSDKNSDTKIKDKIGDAVTGDTEAAKEVLTEAKNKAGAAVGRAYEKVSDQAVSKIDEQKSQLARGLSSVADNLRQVDKNLQKTDEEMPIANVAGKYTSSLAGQIEQFAGYLEKNEVGEMLDDVGDFARKNPAVFIGGAFAAGLLLARFLKSSGSKNNRDNRNSKISGRQGVTGLDPSQV